MEELSSGFLYRSVLNREIAGVDALRAKQSRKLPVVLSAEETGKLLGVLTGEEAVVCKLLYGCGLRLMEGVRLRAGEEGHRAHAAAFLRDASAAAVRGSAQRPGTPRPRGHPDDENLRAPGPRDARGDRQSAG